METEKSSRSKGGTQDAIALLIEDHKKVQQLFKDYQKLMDDEVEDGKEDLATQICNELTVHSQIEEEIFYPAAREAIDEDDMLDEAEVEHASATELIEQIESMEPGDDLYDAKVTVLGEYTNHHIKEEQDEMFPKVKKADLDLVALGQEMAQRKQELKDEMGIDESDDDDDEEPPKAAPRGKKQSAGARK